MTKELFIQEIKKCSTVLQELEVCKKAISEIISVADIEAVTELVDNLETKVDENYETLDQKITDNNNAINIKVDNNYNTLNNKIDNNYNTLNTKIDNSIHSLNYKYLHQVSVELIEIGSFTYSYLSNNATPIIDLNTFGIYTPSNVVLSCSGIAESVASGKEGIYTVQKLEYDGLNNFSLKGVLIDEYNGSKFEIDITREFSISSLNDDYSFFNDKVTTLY